MKYDGFIASTCNHDIQIRLEERFDIEGAKRKSDTGFIKVLVQVIDDRSITPKQQKFIYALFRDISDYTGYPPEWVKDLFKNYYSAYYGTETISLALNGASITEANQMIELLIEFCFQNDIPFHFKEFQQLADLARLNYLFMKYRTCFVCGKQHADVDHVDAVGMGNNRNKINHANRFYFCLCREHHIERHTIGLKAMMEKYHIVPIKLDAESIRELKIGQKGEQDELLETNVSTQSATVERPSF